MAIVDTEDGWYNKSIIKVKGVSKMSPKRRYDIAFKKEIAQIYLGGQRTTPSLAEELGLHVNTDYKWAEQ